MLILLLIIFIVITIAGFVIACGTFEEDLGFMISAGSIIAIMIIIVFSVFNINRLVRLRYIDEKIAMYQEENETIESQIETAVKQYMEYESGTYEEIKNDSDVVVMANLYPELKADSLVQEQIKTYQENNKTIKNLKSQKIEAKASKWWLYFGK